MLRKNTVKVNRSYESFTVADGIFARRNGIIAGGMTARDAKMNAQTTDVAFLDRPYTSNRDIHTGSISGQVEDKLPGYPYQALRRNHTAFPNNRQRNRTGPVTTRELMSALLQENNNETRSAAGQKSVT